MTTAVNNSSQWLNLPKEVRSVIEQFQREAPVDLVGLARALGLTVSGLCRH